MPSVVIVIIIMLYHVYYIAVVENSDKMLYCVTELVLCSV